MFAARRHGDGWSGRPFHMYFGENEKAGQGKEGMRVHFFSIPGGTGEGANEGSNLWFMRG